MRSRTLALTALVWLATAACPERQASSGDKALFHDSFDRENGMAPSARYTRLRQWEVRQGSVDLQGVYPFDYLPPGQGLYLDLDGSTGEAATLRTRRPLMLPEGRYVLSMRLAGCRHVSRPDVLHVRLGSLVNLRIELPAYAPLREFHIPFHVTRGTTAYLELEQEGGDNYGMLLDDVDLRRR